MINQHRALQFQLYNSVRSQLISNPSLLIELEEYLTHSMFQLLQSNIVEIKRDYNEASYLFPFWENYPPEDRGRKPIEDQYPWIEVGEHAIGSKLGRFLAQNFSLWDTGLPTGSDQRFVLFSDEIERITKGLTRAVWLFVDIKSVGPRDDQDHTVMSHNQISGDGEWVSQVDGVRNSVLVARGGIDQGKGHRLLTETVAIIA